MNKHSPTPWRIDGQTIRDAENCVVMSALNPANMETRRLIVEAVNKHRDLITLATIAKGAADEIRLERDGLRDLVRRLVHQFEGRATYDDEAAIIREAREAVGEDK